MSIYKALYDLVCELLDGDVETLSPETRLDGGSILDSLDLVEFIIDICREFDLNESEVAGAGLITIADFAEFVHRKRPDLEVGEPTVEVKTLPSSSAEIPHMVLLLVSNAIARNSDLAGSDIRRGIKSAQLSFSDLGISEERFGKVLQDICHSVTNLLHKQDKLD